MLNYVEGTDKLPNVWFTVACSTYHSHSKFSYYIFSKLKITDIPKLTPNTLSVLPWATNDYL